jgi:hypothetical protein
MGFVKFSNCSCKCCIVDLYLTWNSQIVHVNVTSLFCIWYEILRLFIWMLHHCLDGHCEVHVTSLFCIYTMKFSDCSCECNTIVLDEHCEVLRVFMWMLHRCFVFDMKFSDCLCKCYIIILYLHYEVLRLFM